MSNTVLSPMQLILLLVFIIIVLSFVIGVLFRKHRKGKEGETSQITKILGALEKINEFASHQYIYTDKIEVKKSLTIPLLKLIFKKSATLIVIGKVKIGINLEKIKIQESPNKIEINIPELMIVGHEIEIGESIIQSKLYRFGVIEFNNLIVDWKKKKGEEILKNSEIISDAYKDIKNMITGLLLAFNIKKVIYSIEAPTLLPEAQNDNKLN